MFRRTYLHLMILLLAPAVATAGDAAAGKALYGTCAACHGAAGDGIPAMGAPAVAGQSEAYLVRQLENFRNGVRGTAAGDTHGAQMRPMVATLADEVMVANVAAYMASLPAGRPAATVTGNAGNGSKQYTSKCGACHGGHGQGNDALNSPRLTILSDAYLVRQVKNFQNGARGAHADDKLGAQMKMMSVLVSDEELNDIAAFLNAQFE